MDLDESNGDPFAIPNLWALSSFGQDIAQESSLLFTRGGIDELKADFEVLDLPKQFQHEPIDLDRSVFDPIDPTEVFEESSILSGVDQDELDNKDEGDPWRTISTEHPRAKCALQTWEAFLDPSSTEETSCLLSEAPTAIFDAAIEAHTKENAEESVGNIVKTDPFLKSLVNLALGRSSLYFVYSVKERKFTRRLDNIRMSGYSGDSIDHLSHEFMRCGEGIRLLQDFVESSYAAMSPRPTLISMADTISTITLALQSYLENSSRSAVTALQLRAVTSRSALIVSAICELTVLAQETQEDEQLLNAIYTKIQDLEFRSTWLRDLLLEILRRVARPWMSFVGGWIGLEEELGLKFYKKGSGKGFVKIEQKTWVDDRGIELSDLDYTYDEKKMPVFVPEDDAKVIFETGKSLQFLKKFHPDHPLSKPIHSANSANPSLDWDFSWEKVESIRLKALAYEQTLTQTISQYSSKAQKCQVSNFTGSIENEANFDFFGESEAGIQSYVAKSRDWLDQPPSREVLDQGDDLRSIVYQKLRAEDGLEEDLSMFAPPISITPSLSFCPLTSAQARLVNSSCVWLFFREHRLRQHLSLQRQFHLFGDGIYTARLSHALFDPELRSEEIRPGIASTGAVMGLRLGSRDTWPPASSELRLALMGILTESYSDVTSFQPDSDIRPKSRDGELPGGLSFAVRDLSQDEIDKCMDSHSIQALDFLRLQYKPPPPLEVIITPSCLMKYDRLFKYLLRAVRMLHVVNQLSRDAMDRTSHWENIHTTAQKFRIEAHHFVTCVSSYFFETGVGSIWKILDDKLDDVEKSLDVGKGTRLLSSSEGLDRLRLFHERVLDRILFALLLRKRQEHVLTLLQEIFTLILAFARYSRSRALGSVPDAEEEQAVGETYQSFHKKVGAFIAACRALGAKRGYGEKSEKNSALNAFPTDELFGREAFDEDGGNTIGQLLVKLEMNGFYGAIGGF